MENLEVKENKKTKPVKQANIRVKDIRKEIADKLGIALADQKNVLGENKLNKQIKKISKTLAEEIAKTANRKAKKK